LTQKQTRIDPQQTPGHSQRSPPHHSRSNCIVERAKTAQNMQKEQSTLFARSKNCATMLTVREFFELEFFFD
jgi:hypothetical protein